MHVPNATLTEGRAEPGGGLQMWNKNSKSAPCKAAGKKLSTQDTLPASTRWAGRPSPNAIFISRKLLLEKTGKADICGAQSGSMRRRVPFCLNGVEVGDLKFYEFKMVLELGFLAPERINSFPCVRNCLTLVRPFRIPFAPRHTKPSPSFPRGPRIAKPSA